MSRRSDSVSALLLITAAVACSESGRQCVDASNQMVDSSYCGTTSTNSSYHYTTSHSSSSEDAMSVDRGGFGEAGEAHSSGGGE
jgi:hypothetical protein